MMTKFGTAIVEFIKRMLIIGEFFTIGGELWCLMTMKLVCIQGFVTDLIFIALLGFVIIMLNEVINDYGFKETKDN